MREMGKEENRVQNQSDSGSTPDYYLPSFRDCYGDVLPIRPDLATSSFRNNLDRPISFLLFFFFFM